METSLNSLSTSTQQNAENGITSKELVIRKFYGVEGIQERKNDVVYAPPLADAENTTVVFFGGDIQDFVDQMKVHPTSVRYLDWSLEATTRKIWKNFGKKRHVLTIRPVKIENGTFSRFENFVQSDHHGTPSYKPMCNAINHLDALLRNLNVEISTKNNFNENDIYLVGFSKGCVCLNQILIEMSECQETNDIISRIKKMYFLDGGHSGNVGTWMTSPKVIEALQRFNVNTTVVVTPYQLRRASIRREEQIFSSMARKFAPHFTRVVHNAHAAPTLAVHFDVLNVFTNLKSSRNM